MGPGASISNRVPPGKVARPGAGGSYGEIVRRGRIALLGFSLNIEAAPEDVAAIAEAAERLKLVTDALVANGFLMLKAESRFTPAKELPAPVAPADQIVSHRRTKPEKD
jgi:hypothetical protein